jgi:hypothetical protein
MAFLSKLGFSPQSHGGHRGEIFFWRIGLRLRGLWLGEEIPILQKSFFVCPDNFSGQTNRILPSASSVLLTCKILKFC